MSSRLDEKRSCTSCLKYVLIVSNGLFLLLSAAAIGVLVYLSVEQILLIKGVLGTNLVISAACLLIIAAGILFLFSIFGIIAAALENSTMLIIYFTFLIVAFCSFAAGVVCLGVFQAWLNDQVRYSMENTLRTVYGVQLDNAWNRQVTDSWDKAQSTWQCCSAGDQSWGIYQQSAWYKIQPGVPGISKPYVPASCCVLNQNGKPVDETACQTNQDGPPAIPLGNQYAGNVNNALIYRGCYTAAQDFLVVSQFSWYTVFIGIGIGFAILMIIGISLSVGMYSTVNRRRKLSESNSIMLTFQQSSKNTLPNHYLYSVA